MMTRNLFQSEQFLPAVHTTVAGKLPPRSSLLTVPKVAPGIYLGAPAAFAPSINTTRKLVHTRRQI
jgi:hypothetical protein